MGPLKDFPKVGLFAVVQWLSRVLTLATLWTGTAGSPVLHHSSELPYNHAHWSSVIPNHPVPLLPFLLKL